MPADTNAILAALLTRMEHIETLLLELVRGHRPIEQDDPVAAKVEQLRAACIERGILVSGDGFIRESDAARLLSRAPVTLRNWRYCEKPLPFRMFAGRIEYSIEALAKLLVERRVW